MISSQVTKNVYTANGVTTEWAYTFPIVTASDIELWVATSATAAPVKITTNFTVDTVNEVVVYPSVASLLPPIVSPYVITLKRARPLVQGTQYTSQGGVSPTSIEAALDSVVMMVQDLNEEVSRAVKYAINLTPTEATTEGFLAAMAGYSATASGYAGDALAAKNLAVSAQGLAEAARDTAIGQASIASIQAGLAASSALSITNRLTEGTLALRPAALTGAGFYYATDISVLYFYSPTNGWEAK